jgi:hypothetical protein
MHVLLHSKIQRHKYSKSLESVYINNYLFWGVIINIVSIN